MIKADKSRAVSRFIKSVFPSDLFANRMWIWPLAMLLSFLWFDVVWCMATTFTSFSMAETYINSVLMSLILSLPAMVWRKRWLQWVILVVICIWLECNLLYSRTYFSTIPLESYLLASNLSDFTSSVTDSLRWVDLGFAAIVTIALVYGFPHRRDVTLSFRNKLIYCSYILFLGLVSSCMLVCRGGFKQAWERLENGNYHSCRIPMFTVVGSMVHDYMSSGKQMSESDKEMVDNWLNFHSSLAATDSTMSGGVYDSMVLILCESLESWPIGLTVEGKEITPNLNSLVNNPSTLYSSKVLSQVGPGRSIDAQLIINAGMLPMERGVYSMQVPFNTYHTLNQALKLKNASTRSYLLTVDKPVVWNQGAVAASFGIDTLLSKSSWRIDEQAGARKKLGDRSFFRQAVEKMRRGEIWPEGEPAFIQMVTYSGHNPFILSPELDNLHLTGNYPEMVKRYLTVAHYTDEGLGIMLNYLRSRSDFMRTLIVITGDHEGLAGYRNELASEVPFVSNNQFVPLIVGNAPAGGKISGVVGQIDIYTTLLNILDAPSSWHGMGVDMRSNAHPHIAVGSDGLLVGDTTGIDESSKAHLLSARHVSDLMLRFNLLGRE